MSPTAMNRETKTDENLGLSSGTHPPHTTFTLESAAAARIPCREQTLSETVL